MGEQWGLSVKLFGKTILVVPTSKGADDGQVCSDELLKVTKCTETEEEISVGRESGSLDPKAETGKGGSEEETEDDGPDELELPQQEEKQIDAYDDNEMKVKESAAVTEGVHANKEKEEDGEKKKQSAAAEKAADKNKILPCPRCKSEDTKFCYYNNYNVNQPRHFCRNCQRYWTAGGTMRNVPVGAGRRKSKSAAVAAADPSNSFYVFMLRQQQQQLQHSYITAEAAGLHQPPTHTNTAGTVLSFSPSTPVGCVTTPIGHVSPPSETAPRVVLVYSPAASTPTTSSTAVTRNQSIPYYNNFTTKKEQQLCYHSRAAMNVPNASPNPVCASNYEPWKLMPAWQQPMHLGKHMRDGENNVKGDVKQRRHEEEEDDENRRNRNIWVPKALRITDTPDAAASSSIWTTITTSGLGFNKKDQNHCSKKAPSSAMERGFFNAFHAKEAQVANSTTRANHSRDALLSANPAALARSHQFHETV